MTLSRKQIEDEKDKYLRWFWIHERDLLFMAQEHPAWRDLAHKLGYTDEWIDEIRDPNAQGWKRFWPFKDEGRRIKYMENPWYKNAKADN